MRIGVDLMGSETSPRAIFAAVTHVQRALPSSDSLLVIAHHALQPELTPLDPTVEFITTDEAIEMDESPLVAVRRKKNSTIAVGMRLLKEGNIDAFISTGNTGALVATARFHLPNLPGVERPALLVMMPPGVAVLDVGANINPKPDHLITYAKLGASYRTCAHGMEKPRIGLLNIGVEEQKGTKELKETYAMLQQEFGASFLGNIEGREVFEGKVDVLVTDGFSGNVFLKTSEGISRFIIEYINSQFAAPEIVAQLNDQFNYAAYPGAFLAGVDGLIVKCHGASNTPGLINAIHGAFTLLHRNIFPTIKSTLSE